MQVACRSEPGLKDFAIGTLANESIDLEVGKLNIDHLRRFDLLGDVEAIADYIAHARDAV